VLLTDPYVQVVGALEGEEEEVQLLKNLSVRKDKNYYYICLFLVYFTMLLVAHTNTWQQIT